MTCFTTTFFMLFQKHISVYFLLPTSYFSKFTRMKKYHLATYGCQMNEYDSAMIAQELDMCGCVETNNQEDADIIIVNTCSVREKAD